MACHWPRKTANGRGQGAGAFQVTYPQYADESVRLHFDHAHNDFLQFFIEYGAIGSVLLALFVGWALYYAMAALWQTKSLFSKWLRIGHQHRHRLVNDSLIQ